MASLAFMDAKAMSARARKMVEDGAVLLDVRTPQEYAEGHLPGSVNIPIQALPGRLGELGSARTAVVYCKMGARAAMAEQILRANGFQDVLNIGHMGAW